jgi:hypothetical protein
MRVVNPLFIFSIWMAVGIWAATNGHPAVLILLAGYVSLLVLPFGIVWLWNRTKNKKSN